MSALLTQFVNLLGAVLLMLAFAMISQRRILSLIHLFTMQGATLALAEVSPDLVDPVTGLAIRALLADLRP